MKRKMKRGKTHQVWRSQAPFIYWACAAMGIAYIYLRDVQVVAHHVQAAMNQQFLQRKHIATAALKLNRECVGATQK